MEVTTHSNHHRKRDVSIVLGESTAQPPEKSMRRDGDRFDPSHQQQHAATAVAPPQHTPAATAPARGRVSSFSISMILADTGTDETSSSSLTMEPDENLQSPGSPPQTDYSINLPYRDVIDVSDDEADRQSVVSSVDREAEPARCSEMQLRQKLIVVKRHSLDLEQKMLNMEKQLAMKEDMLQRERRAAQGAEKRADKAENLLKSQNDRDGLKHNALLNMEKQLASKEDMLQRERRAKEEAELRADQAEKLLKSQVPLDDSKKSEQEKQISDLKRQLEKGWKRNDKSVDELKSKLAVYENLKQVQWVMDEIERRKTNPRMDKFADRQSILRLLKSRSAHAMPIDEAVERVCDAFGKCGEKAKKKCEDKRAWFNCDPCGIEVHDMLTATTHFLSKEHIEKVRFHHACVSSLAVMGWVDELVHFYRST